MVEEHKTAEHKTPTHSVSKNEIIGSPIDFTEEYKQSFSHALLTDKYMTMTLDYILNTNPIEVILKNLEGLDEGQKKDVQERVKAQMQTWLGTFESVLEEGKTLPVDLIGRASDLARERRKG